MSNLDCSQLRLIFWIFLLLWSPEHVSLWFPSLNSSAISCLEAKMENHNASFLSHVGIKNKHLEPLLESPVAEFFSSLSFFQGSVLFLCLFWGYSSLQVHRRVKVAGTPVHGYWSWFEPTWVLQLRYARDAHKIIASGYEKVRLPHERCSRENTLNNPVVQQERQGFRTASSRSGYHSSSDQVHLRAANDSQCQAQPRKGELHGNHTSSILA